MDDKLIGCCGLVCSDCGAYQATRTMDHARAEQVAAEWSQQFHADVKVEHVWCDGCTQPGKKCAHCGECELRSCALGRGLSSCGACDDYPCAQLTAFFALVPPAKVVLDRVHASR